MFDYSNKWNTVAIVTDGTRVLGLGDIGPEASLPVMEGKALLYKYLGGVDAVPICIGTKLTSDIVSAVKWIQHSFGGINLEDIASPKCFDVLDQLRRELPIPVWHDDQQGTATALLGGFLNALKVVGKRITEVKVMMVGAANVATANLLVTAGVKSGNIIMVDKDGALNHNRNDLKSSPRQWDLCLRTNEDQIQGGLDAAITGADACIAMSRPGPGVITPKQVSSMNDNAIVFACANPTPEIWPWEAKEAGAKVIATGRSDFDNQLNNSLVFPAVFRGALDVRSKSSDLQQVAVRISKVE